MTTTTEPRREPAAAKQAEPIGLAVVGAGYWGPNLLRNAMATPAMDVRWLCDLDQDRARRVVGPYSTVATTDAYDDVLGDPRVQAVAIATPAASHFPLAMAALDAGKHVLVEKPLTSSLADGEKLVQAADDRGLVLMCDHTYCYTSAVQELRRLVHGGDLGRSSSSTRSGSTSVSSSPNRRPVGPGPPRPVDPRLPAPGRRVRRGRRGPRRRPDRARHGVRRVPDAAALDRGHGARPRQLAEPDQDPHDGDRRLAADRGVGRHESRPAAGGLRPGRRPPGPGGAGRRRAEADQDLLPDRRDGRAGAARSRRRCA